MSLTNKQAYERARSAIFMAWDDGEKQLLNISADDIHMFESALKNSIPSQSQQTPKT